MRYLTVLVLLLLAAGAARAEGNTIALGCEHPLFTPKPDGIEISCPGHDVASLRIIAHCELEVEKDGPTHYTLACRKRKEPASTTAQNAV